MVTERVLSLDVSSKTGYASAISSDSGFTLENYGQITKIECPENEKYPASFVTWAYECYGVIEDLINRHHPDVLVIEETCSGSKSVYSQKILEFTHFLLARFIKETEIKNIYLMTGVWRKQIGSFMNATEKKRNKEVKEYKKKNKSKLAYDINGKRIGKISKKHVTIRLINETFADQLKTPLRRKDEDQADAISLNWAYHLKRKEGLYV